MNRKDSIIGTTLLCIILIAPVFTFFLVFKFGNVLSSTSLITQIIEPGVLSTDFIDDSYQSVASPSIAMSNKDFSFACYSSTGTLGTSSQMIYVTNPDSADGGWSLTIAPANVTDLWVGTNGSYDFNDPTGAGCTDGVDADNYGGQMSINASGATLSIGACPSCNTTGISKGSLASYSQGSVNSITLLSADSSSSDMGDWTLTGVSVIQSIPGEQPAGNDYALNLVLTVTAL